jgi:hypothetical protein
MLRVAIQMNGDMAARKNLDMFIICVLGA